MWHVARRSTLTCLDSELSCASSKATTEANFPPFSLSLPFSASFCAQLIILINRTGAPQVVVEPYVMRAHLASRFPISPTRCAILGLCNCNSSRATASSCCCCCCCCFYCVLLIEPILARPWSVSLDVKPDQRLPFGFALQHCAAGLGCHPIRPAEVLFL